MNSFLCESKLTEVIVAFIWALSKPMWPTPSHIDFHDPAIFSHIAEDLRFGELVARAISVFLSDPDMELILTAEA